MNNQVQYDAMPHAAVVGAGTHALSVAELMLVPEVQEFLARTQERRVERHANDEALLKSATRLSRRAERKRKQAAKARVEVSKQSTADRESKSKAVAELEPPEVKVEAAPAKPSATRKAVEAKRMGPFQDKNGRWHQAHGPFMSFAQATELGLMQASAAPPQVSKSKSPKRTGPFQDKNGRWHHAHGPFMSNVDAVALGLRKAA